MEAEVLSSEETKGAVYRLLYGWNSDPNPAELHNLETRIHFELFGLQSTDDLSFETSHGAIKLSLNNFQRAWAFSVTINWHHNSLANYLCIFCFINNNPVRDLKSAECDIWPGQCVCGGLGSCGLPVLRLLRLGNVDMIIRCQRYFGSTHPSPSQLIVPGKGWYRLHVQILNSNGCLLSSRTGTTAGHEAWMSGKCHLWSNVVRRMPMCNI